MTPFKVRFAPIPGFPGYHASSDGRIWSSISVTVDSPGSLRMLALRTHWKGYRAVGLMKDHKKHMFFVHQLVLLAFVGPRPDGMETRHLDGNRENNRLGNLAYGTSVENESDKRRHGTETDRPKLTPDAVREIRQQANCGLTAADLRALADRFGVTSPTVRRAARGDTWRNV